MDVNPSPLSCPSAGAIADLSDESLVLSLGVRVDMSVLRVNRHDRSPLCCQPGGTARVDMNDQSLFSCPLEHQRKPIISIKLGTECRGLM